jgi:hypothetical protein
MSRPSDPLLRLIRDLARKKAMNTAALAVESGIERGRLKHVLGGAESMTVDELLLIANALQIDARTLGMQGPDFDDGGKDDGGKDDGNGTESTAPAIVPERSAPWLVDPYGNHAEQALRLGFGLGCNLWLRLDSSSLGASGIPVDVIQSQGEMLRIQLDAAYHRHNKPVFHADHLQIVLGFGTTLHTVKIPWESFRQVALEPLPPQPQPTIDPAAPKGQGRGHLRLVE